MNQVLLLTLPVGELDGISVFEAKIDKKVILFDQDANLVSKEREVVSLENVSGPVLKVGSLEEVNTNETGQKHLQTSNIVSHSHKDLSIQIHLNGLSLYSINLH